VAVWLSVNAYACNAADNKTLFNSIYFRIYKSVLAAVNKTQEGHPFRVSDCTGRTIKHTTWSSSIYFVKLLFVLF